MVKALKWFGQLLVMTHAYWAMSVTLSPSRQLSRRMGDGVVGTCVVVPEEVESVGNAQIIVEKASNKCIHLCVAELSLAVPGKVVLQ